MANKTLECNKIQSYLGNQSELSSYPVYYGPPVQAPSTAYVIINEIGEYSYDIEKKGVIEVRVVGNATRTALKGIMSTITELLSSEHTSVRDMDGFKFYKCVEGKGPHPITNGDINELVKEFIFYFVK